MIYIKRKISFIIIVFGFLISPIYAVSDIQISPSSPKVGDTITLTGKANPNEVINCQAWFEVSPMLSPPYYGYLMDGVEIPSSPNSFKVIAENVNKVSVSVNMGIWITKSANADGNGIATVSQSNVPVGTYDMKIGGTIKDTSKPVKLKIIASTTINADENGNFEYSYKTNNIPEGTTVYLNIGGINKEIIVGGDTPAPPVLPVVNDTTNTDKEPPKITILSPSKRDYNTSNVDFEVIVKDESDYVVKFYLNGDGLGYKESGNYYTGTLNLKEGENTFKIIAKDEYDNENSKIIYINYNKPNQKEENNTIISTTNKNENITNSQTISDKNMVDDKSNIIIDNKDNNKDNNSNQNQKNIIQGMIIKHVGNATLTVPDGTEISTVGDIRIKEIIIPNTTLAYYILPDNAEFSKPLTLEISLNVPEGAGLKILYYDEQMKSWKSIPYVYDKNTSEITISITKSGYYAIKESDISTNENNKSIFSEITMVVKIVINAIVSLIKSRLNLA